MKGLEPNLYECLAATFHQDYPSAKLTIYFCVSSRTDPAFPILTKLIEDFPAFDVRILVEEEDPELQRNGGNNLGPNPKIRNMSRGYREAKGDILWIIDCNVWVGRGVCGRMVDKLCGYSSSGSKTPYKFVHHLPIVVDVKPTRASDESLNLLQASNMDTDTDGDLQISSSSTEAYSLHTSTSKTSLLSTSGGRLEELFLSSSHAKMYTAINTVLVAPCIIGKSNMFRRSHLNHLTASNPAGYSAGIDAFSDNICEDHLIGDILFKQKIPEQQQGQQKWGKHGLVFGDLAIQPMAGMSVGEYVARRVRWLRVRKFTVMLATLVEPGTESFLCSAYGAFALTTLPYFHTALSIPQTWLALFLLWLLSVTVWAAVDWTVYLKLHSGATIEVDEHTPAFARPPKGRSRRPFTHWLAAWLGREALALPIWLWAVWGGVTVTWRERRFWVGLDMRVHEIKDQVGKRRD